MSKQTKVRNDLEEAAKDLLKSQDEGIKRIARTILHQKQIDRLLADYHKLRAEGKTGRILALEYGFTSLPLFVG